MIAMKKNIVFIVGMYKPFAGPVGICMDNILQCLTDDMSVSVICGIRKHGDSDHASIGGVEIHRIASRQNRLRSLCLAKSYGSSRWISKSLWKLGFQSIRVMDFISILFSRNSAKMGLVQSYEKALESLPIKPDLLVPACMPFEAVLAANAYCQSHQNVQYVPFLFDKFADNKALNRLKINMSIKKRCNQRLEKKVLNADSCPMFVYVESWKTYLERDLKIPLTKGRLIEHPLLINRTDLTLCKRKATSVIKYVYTGALTVAARNPAFVLDVFTRVLDRQPYATLDIYGSGDAIQMVRSAAKASKGAICYRGFVGSDEVSKVISEADILLSVGNSDITQMPSKIFEYMSYGKPIIHIAKSPNDPVLEILEKYPLSLCLVESEGSQADKVNQIIRFADSCKSKVVSFDDVVKCFPRALPEYSADLLRSLVLGVGGTENLEVGK